MAAERNSFALFLDDEVGDDDFITLAEKAIAKSKIKVSLPPQEDKEKKDGKSKPKAAAADLIKPSGSEKGKGGSGAGKPNQQSGGGYARRDNSGHARGNTNGYARGDGSNNARESVHVRDAEGHQRQGQGRARGRGYYNNNKEGENQEHRQGSGVGYRYYRIDSEVVDAERNAAVTTEGVEDGPKQEDGPRDGPKQEEDNRMTLKEYEKLLAEKKAASEVKKVEERKAILEDKYEFIGKKKNEFIGKKKNEEENQYSNQKSEKDKGKLKDKLKAVTDVKQKAGINIMFPKYVRQPRRDWESPVGAVVDGEKAGRSGEVERSTAAARVHIPELSDSKLFPDLKGVVKA